MSDITVMAPMVRTPRRRMQPSKQVQWKSMVYMSTMREGSVVVD